MTIYSNFFSYIPFWHQKCIVTRWTKQTFPCAKFLSPGVSFGPIQHYRGLKFIESGYLSFTASLRNFCLHI